MERATTKAPTSETPRTSRISAPEMIASRCDSFFSSRAFCSIWLRSVSSILDICSILAVSSSTQSLYERLSCVCRPPEEPSTRLAYSSAAWMVGLPWSMGLVRSSAPDP